MIILGAGCQKETTSTSYYNSSYTGSSYSDSSSNSSYDEEERVAPENPYDEGSGHSAGYEWAEETGGDCNGNSASFNEGCEEFYNQQ
ncbi:MAG: hypothetical protein WC477_05800 [Patescibacteria group bacterium]